MKPTLFQGIAAACVSGLVFGAAMQPQLASADVAGPQLWAGVSAERSGEAWGGTGWTAPGPVPDYVTGADWLRPPPAMPDYEVVEVAYADEPAVEVEPLGPPPWLADWEFVKAERPAFPSEGGDILAGVEAPPPAAAEPQAPYPDA